MKLVYVIGPYRGRTEYEVHQNIQRARAVAEELWRRGYGVICPHLNSAHMGGLVPDSRFLRAGLEMLRRSDAFAVAPGWRRSAGSIEEIKLALKLRKEFIPTEAGVKLLRVKGSGADGAAAKGHAERAWQDDGASETR